MHQLRTLALWLLYRSQHDQGYTHDDERSHVAPQMFPFVHIMEACTAIPVSGLRKR
jgi:hypothetical protein